MKITGTIIKMFFFVIASFFLSATFITYWVDSMIIRNILGIFTFIIIVAVNSGILIKFKRNGNVFSKSMNLGIVSLTIIFFLIFFTPIFHTLKNNEHIWGNNANTSAYTNGIGMKGYQTVEDALDDIVERDDMDYLYFYENEYLYILFYHHAGSFIQTYDLWKNDGKLYYIGGCLLIYDSQHRETKYSEQATIQADILASQSRSSLFRKMPEGPVWGITLNSEIAEAEINSQKVEFVKEISSDDGTIYYFWFISDLGTYDKAADLTIKGLK